MNRNRPGLWLFTLLLLLLSCATPTQRRYYTIASGITAIPAKIRFPADLWVKDVDIAPVYNRPEIVYRYSPQELQYYNASNWADRPGRMVTRMLETSLQKSGLFRTVVTRLDSITPTYFLTGSVEALEELDAGDEWYAHLAMNLQLIRFEDKLLIWQYGFDERRPLNQRDLTLVVRALSEIYQDQLNNYVLPQLEAVLGGRPLPVAPIVMAPVVPGKPMKVVPDTSAPVVPGTNAQPATATTSQPATATTSQPATATTLQATLATTAEAVPLETPHHTEAPPPIEDPSNPDRAPMPGATTPTQSSRAVGTPSSNPDGFRRVDWRKNRQYTSDPTQVPTGKGAIFLPALSEEPGREPEVEVYAEDQRVTQGYMGRRIVVSPGTYRVYFGSGTLSQRITRTVTVVPDETTAVQADWSTLDISVMDEKFIPFRGSYELIRMDDREFVGTGYGADEERGEQTQVWVLSPGLYKIIQPGSTYRARTNFATVQLQPGTLVPFTLVQDAASRDFLGAGVSDKAIDWDSDNVWSLRVSIGGTALVNQRSDELTNPGTGFSFQVFSDNLLRFSLGRHLWTTRLDIEEGKTLSTTLADGTQGSFLKGDYNQSTLADLVYLNSIYVYRLLPWVGPYLRIGGDTQLFPSYQNFITPTDVVILDAGGNQTESISQSQQEKLSSAFSPLELRQGAGANFKLFHNTHLDMDLRAGLGIREFLANGLLRVEDDAATPEFELQTATNSIQAGPELALLATARITRMVRLTTDFDSLVPFQGLDQTQFKWRNTINLRLTSYASLSYTFNLDRNSDIGLIKPLTYEQGIQFRFAFTPF